MFLNLLIYKYKCKFRVLNRYKPLVYRDFVKY
jgi:hypothetical protein